MSQTKKQSLVLRVFGWSITLISFIIGFWHTFLGLREFRIISSENGGLLVAFLIFMVMMLSYIVAINGRKNSLIIYFICACLYFVFNLNSFYPSYLGNTLLKEETKAIIDSINIYKSKLDKIVGVNNLASYQIIQNLNNHSENIITEIKNRGGFGPYATDELSKFNSLAKSNITPERKIEKDSSKRNLLVIDYKKRLDKAIQDYTIKSMSGSQRDAIIYVKALHDIDDVNRIYASQFDSIMKDNLRLNTDSIKYNKQVKGLQGAITELDKIAIAVNSVKIPAPFNLLNGKGKTIKPEIQMLGTFQHTLSSIKKE